MNQAAVFSFLRVLAVALASAVLPFVTAPGSDDVPLRAVLTAVASAFLLTVINYFRPGEQRFGPHRHDVGHDEHGAVDLNTVVTVALGILVAVAVLYVLRLAL